MAVICSALVKLGLYLITTASMLFDPRDRRAHSLDLTFILFFFFVFPPRLRRLPKRADRDAVVQPVIFEHLHSQGR